MENIRKNPFVTGLLNAVIPGLGHVYVNRDWRKFAWIFVICTTLIVSGLVAGNNLQRGKNYLFPQGLCPGTLALIVLIPLFVNGQNIARENNVELDDAAVYRSRTALSVQDDDATKLQKLQRNYREGRISEKEFADKKDEISKKKE
jgi:hypothetical protein